MNKLFGVPIFKSVITFPDEERKKLTDYILKIEDYCEAPNDWLCDLKTSFKVNSKLHLLNNFQFISTMLNSYAEQYAKDINFDYYNYTIYMSRMWFNVYRKNHSQEKHDHGRSFLSSTFMLQIPKGASNFVFYNPLHEGLISYPVIEDNELIMSNIESKQNKLLIFPGWLEHGVKLNNTVEPRITISANWQIQPRGG